MKSLDMSPAFSYEVIQCLKPSQAGPRYYLYPSPVYGALRGIRVSIDWAVRSIG